MTENWNVGDEPDETKKEWIWRGLSSEVIYVYVKGVEEAKGRTDE